MAKDRDRTRKLLTGPSKRTKAERAESYRRMMGEQNPAVRNCGECLMSAVEIVRLDSKGVCPRCGADYGKAS